MPENPGTDKVEDLLRNIQDGFYAIPNRESWSELLNGLKEP